MEDIGPLKRSGEITVEPSLMEALTVITAENPTAPCVFTVSISKINYNFN